MKMHIEQSVGNGYITLFDRIFVKCMYFSAQICFIVGSSIMIPTNTNTYNENHDIDIAISSSVSPVLGLNIPSYCPGCGYLNV